MGQIKTKSFEYGNECEAEWPSQFGTLDKTPMYFDKESGQVKPGYPPQAPKNGQAPMVLFDAMPPTYHEKAGRVIESRSEWKMVDEQTGCLTFGSREEIARTTKARVEDEKREIKKDRRNAGVTALQAYKENPKEVRAKCDKQAEQQIEAAKQAGLTDQLKKAGIRYE